MKKDFTDVLSELEELEPEIIEDEEVSDRKADIINSDEDLNRYIIEKSSEVIEKGLEALDTLMLKVKDAGDAESIDSLTKTMKSISTTMNNLTKINIQNKKAEQNANKKQKTPMIAGNNQQIFIGTRESALKMLNDKKEELPAPDIEEIED